MDSSSKEVSVITHHDIRNETVTFTRDELRLIVEGAELGVTNRLQAPSARVAERKQECFKLVKPLQEVKLR